MNLLLLCASFVLLHSTAVEHVRLQVGDGTVVQDATVVWNHDSITAVGRGVAIPADAERIDGTHKILTPGLIETRSHLGVSEVDEETSTVDTALEKDLATPALRVADGFNPASIRIPVARQAGITAAIVMPEGRILHGTGSWVHLTGLMSERPDPTQPIAMFGSISRLSSGTLSARGGIWLALREYLEDTRFYQRNRAAFDKGDARNLSLRPHHLAALLPVLEGKLPLVLEANRASDIVAAVEFARAEKLKLVIAGGAEAWRVAAALAAANVPVILHPTHAEPSSFEQLGARVDAAKILHDAQVPLILAAGDATMEVPRLRQEAGLAVAYGLPYDAALPAISSTPARVFGRDKEEGTVAVGKRAHLVLWSDDPLETTTLAEKVWIGGVLQSAPTRQDLLVQRYMRGPAAPPRTP